MTLEDLVNAINDLADEDESIETITNFLNDAIATINVECRSKFPFFYIGEPDTNYEGFPETWQRALLIPFGVGRVKQKDSSQFEYTDAYAEFLGNLGRFKQHYVIPEEYKDEQARNKYYLTDFNQHMFSWGNKGGGFNPLS